MFTNSLNAANWINCDECLHMGGVTLDLITERGIWMRLWTGTDKTDGILESSTMIVEGSSLEQLVLDGIKDERYSRSAWSGMEAWKLPHGSRLSSRSVLSPRD
jgi:hypothetical protein